MWKFFCSVTFVLVCVQLSSSDAKQINQTELPTTVGELVDQLKLEILTKTKDLTKSKQYLEQLDDVRKSMECLNLQEELIDLSKMFTTRQISAKSCINCNNLLKLFRIVPLWLIKNQLTAFCQKSSLISHDVCFGLLNRFWPPIVYIITETKLSNAEMCAVLGGHGCLRHLNDPSQKIYWEVALPPRKPFNPKLGPTLENHKKVLHLTDVHLDLEYSVGGSAKCTEPLCCRASSVANGSERAGFWGQPAGHCDIPNRFMKNSIRLVGERHRNELSYFFWTGDNPPHNVWETSIEGNLAHIKVVTDEIKEHLDGVTVVPVLGNHEVHPVNMFVPNQVTKFNSKWLYDKLANDYWAEWIDTPEAKQTFVKGGYYAKQLGPNWRALVLNSNVGYKANLWILYDHGDFDGQLTWLVDELDKAESEGTYVSILSHIPPTEEMSDSWLHNYIRIVERFSHLITGAYNGHTHLDEIRILFGRMGQPVGVNYLGGSLTTFSDLNPMYRIFEMNPNGVPLDFQTHYLDLFEDNREHHKNSSSIPQWIQGFCASEDYKLPNLSPNSWNEWRDRAFQDSKLFELYYRNYHRSSRSFPNASAQELHDLFVEMGVLSPFR